MGLQKRLFQVFDKLEDHTRIALSHRPILYSLVGSVGIILFWRGIWHTADTFAFMTGPLSIILGLIIMLFTGLFVSSFVGDHIIMSGLRREKKTTDQIKDNVQTEMEIMEDIQERLKRMELSVLYTNKEFVRANNEPLSPDLIE